MVKSEGDGLSVDQAGAPPSWVLCKFGTGERVTFDQADRLGQWVLDRWRAAQVPTETECELWGIMGALAWIATRQINLARRAAYFDGHAFKPKAQPRPVQRSVVRLGRPTAPRGDLKRRHEWAALAHEALAHCTCQPRATEWSDCRCLDRAFDQLQASIKAGELLGYAWTDGVSRRALTGADLIGLHRPANGLPSLALANGVVRIEFVPMGVRSLFSARGLRGRPAGNGIDDSAELVEMIRLLEAGEASTPTEAARLASGAAAGSTHGTSTIDRLRTKYRQSLEK